MADFFKDVKWKDVALAVLITFVLLMVLGRRG